MNDLRKFSALLFALCLTGCGTPPPENTPAPAEASETSSEDAPAPDSLADAAAFMADDFTAYWDSADHVMMLPVVNVFWTDRFDGMDKTVFLVYPTYKMSQAVIYGITGGTVSRIGEIDSGYEFALSSADGGMLRTSWTLEGPAAAPDTGETVDAYYTVSPDDAANLLTIGLYTAGEEQTATVYDGEETQIPLEEYHSRKDAVEANFSDSSSVRFDRRVFGGFEFLSGGDFAAYILERLSGPAI